MPPQGTPAHDSPHPWPNLGRTGPIQPFGFYYYYYYYLNDEKQLGIFCFPLTFKAPAEGALAACPGGGNELARSGLLHLCVWVMGLGNPPRPAAQPQPRS